MREIKQKIISMTRNINQTTTSEVLSAKLPLSKNEGVDGEEEREEKGKPSESKL